MKALIAICTLALMPLLGRAQDMPSPQNPSEPRFGVGIELLKPFGRTATDYWNNTAGIELQFTYRPTGKRAWRAGYGFSRTEGPPYASWSFRESGVVETFQGWYDRYHQLSLGHQWYFGNGRLRPFVGADVYLGYEEVGNYNSTRTYGYDSLQVGVGFGEPVERESRWRYYEGLHLGLGGAVGLEYRPHKHLSLQLRASLGQFWAVPLSDEDADRFGLYRYGRMRLPQVGTGVFVQFEF
jgi:hypothetical protein